MNFLQWKLIPLTAQFCISVIGITLYPPPPQKNYLRKKIPEELFLGGMRQIRVINYAKEFSENYFLGSYVNFA